MSTGYINAQDFIGLAVTKGDFLWGKKGGIRVYGRLQQNAASGLENQLGGAAAGPLAQADIGPALEKVGGIRPQVELLGSGANVLRFETRGLDQHIGRTGFNFAVQTAHHTGQGNRLGLVGDQEHLIGQRMLLSIEGDEFFPSDRQTDNHRGHVPRLGRAEQAEVKSVQGMAGFQHDVIGYVNHIVNAAHAGLFHGGTQPVRAGGDFHPAQQTGGVPRTKLRLLNAHSDKFARPLAAQLRSRKIDLWQPQGAPGQCTQFAGNADDAVPVRTVGGDFQIKHHIAGRPFEIFGEGLADHGIFLQDEQAIHFFGQAEFVR